MSKPRIIWLPADQRRIATLKKKIAEMKKLLIEYRDQPNCGEYGFTRGWWERVDKAIGKVK